MIETIIPIDKNKKCFLVITNDGHFGNGKTVNEAAANAQKAGARKTSIASISHVYGANTASYDGMYITYDASNVETLYIGSGFKLGSLLTIKS